MNNILNLFHWISHIKYPLMALGLYYAYKPLLFDDSTIFQDYNNMLLIMGIAISLDALKDYKKLTWLDRKVYQNPKLAVPYLIFFSLLILSFMGLGLYGYFYTSSGALKELSIGLTIFGLGCIGLLKSGIQVAKSFMEQE